MPAKSLSGASDNPAPLRAVRKGGAVIGAGIHVRDSSAFACSLLWGERSIRSVANLTCEDGDALFSLIARRPVTTQVRPFPLAEANATIAALRARAFDGAAVLVP